MIGCDIHSDPGFLKVNQKMSLEDGGIIDDLVKCMVPCSDGNTYAFGSTNGKIWKRTSAGVWSYVATVAPAAGAVGVMDAKEYQGYIYYSMQSRLGRVAVGSPTDWTSRNDSFATFTNTDPEFHPMREVNQVLYIGDKHYVAQVNAGTFSANALDIKTPLRIKSLGKIATDLLIGTYVSDIRVATEILRWNTWSRSYSVADEIPEIGINSFLAMDNFVLVNAGVKGNLYVYDGSTLSRFKRIPGTWSGSKAALIHPNATVNMFGLPLFALSNVSGNPALQGIYSLGSYDRNYPDVLNAEYPISEGEISNVDFGSLYIAGTDLLSSWKYAFTVTMTIASPAVVTAQNHGLANGRPITFSTTGALPTGVTAGVVYYVGNAAENTFNLYDTAANAIAGGSTGRVNTSGAQSGTHSAQIYGIDVLDTDAKLSGAYVVTKALNLSRNEQKVISGFAGYRTLPAGTEIKFWQKANWSDTWVEIPTRVDTIKKTVFCHETAPMANVIEIQVSLTASGNDAPEIDTIELSFP